jgi:Holliday junction resolvasome RuvABC endonuclease subunit
MTYVLGVDPGYISGWAIVGLGTPRLRLAPGDPIEWGQTGKKGQRTTGSEIADVIENRLSSYRPLVLAMEGQYVLDGGGKGDANHAKTLSTFKTARIRGMWEAVAEIADVDLFAEDGIQATTWRNAVWGRGRWTTEQSKKHAVAMALAAWGVSVLKTHHHEAEAMWIATYAQRELQIREQQRSLGL